jgi:hypothetical protein
MNLNTLIAEARASLKEDVIKSLEIIARDDKGRTNRVMGGFVARFKNDRDHESFLRTARMEYPGIDKYMRTKSTPKGIEVALSPRDAARFEH